MSVAVSRSDGVAVLTLTSDQPSACPPLCQLLGALCYSPALCSVSRRLPPQRGGPQAALGALWIITGIMHIGLGTVLITNRSLNVYSLRDTGCAPVWLGGLFALLGVCCVLAQRNPRAIAVLLSGLLNLAGVALSIAAVVWYCIELGDRGLSYRCGRPYWYHRGNDRRHWTTPAPTAAPPDQDAVLRRCDEGRVILRALATSVFAILVALSVLNFCVGVSSVTLSFKALKRAMSRSGNTPQPKEAKATTGKMSATFQSWQNRPAGT